MKRLVLAIALACALSGLAQAGEIHPTGAVATPTPKTVTVTGEMHPTGPTAPGEITSTGATAPGEILSTGATAPEGSSTALTIFLTLLSIVF